MKYLILVLMVALVGCDRYPSSDDYANAQIECGKLGLQVATIPFSASVGCFNGSSYYKIKE